MPKTLTNLIAFSGGEWTPKMDARIDQPKYGSAERICQNMIPYKTGGLTRRPATLFKARAKYEDTDVFQYAARLVSFQFSPTTSFILELGHEYIRFYSNQQQVESSPGVPYEVASPYRGRSVIGPSLFSIPIWTVTPCQINDVVYFAHPDYPPYKLTRIADTEWTMQEVNFITPALLDTNSTDTTITASGTTGSVTLTASAPAWVTATYYQIGDSVLEAGVIYNCLVSHVSGTFATDLAAGYWESVDIFDSEHVGSTWQLGYLADASYLEIVGTAAAGFVDGTSGTFEASGSCRVYTKGVWSSDIALQQSFDQGVTWTTIRTLVSRSDANFDNPVEVSSLSLFRFVITNSAALVSPGSTDPRVVFEALDGFRYGLVKITAVGGPYTATTDVVTELLNTSATLYWAEAAWSEYRGYPRAITAFQQRMIYGGTAYEPQRIWGSVTNDLENFDKGDQTKATDSFAFDIAAVGRGGIQWLIGQVDLFAGFSGAEWIINAGQGSFGGSSQPITPTAINAGEHSSFGSASGIPPIIAGNAVLYTQRNAQTIQQMIFSVYTNKYMSMDLTEYSEHLFADGVAQMAYQPLFRNQSVIWVTTKSGSLCGMTYELNKELNGWHRHLTSYGDPSTTGISQFESVACIDGQNGQDDEVWVVVDRGSRYIELMNPNNWETSGPIVNGVPTPNPKEAIYVDCATSYVNPGTLTLTGLSRFANRTVYGLADGLAVGPMTVTAGGEVTLPPSIPTTVTLVHIGLPIYYIGQSMRVDWGGRGATQSIYKQLSDVWVRVYNSMGGSIGNGTTTYPYWVSTVGQTYLVGDNVRSPLNNASYSCIQDVVGSAVDPSQDPTNWQAIASPSYQAPVPIPYTNNPSNPFGVPSFVNRPKDIRITPQQMPTPGTDPIFQVQGNDALPITVLALVLHEGVTGVP